MFDLIGLGFAAVRLKVYDFIYAIFPVNKMVSSDSALKTKCSKYFLQVRKSIFRSCVPLKVAYISFSNVATLAVSPFFMICLYYHFHTQNANSILLKTKKSRPDTGRLFFFL